MNLTDYEIELTIESLSIFLEVLMESPFMIDERKKIVIGDVVTLISKYRGV